VNFAFKQHIIIKLTGFSAYQRKISGTHKVFNVILNTLERQETSHHLSVLSTSVIKNAILAREKTIFVIKRR
jgi:hypothetical protein